MSFSAPADKVHALFSRTSMTKTTFCRLVPVLFPIYKGSPTSPHDPLCLLLRVGTAVDNLRGAVLGSPRAGAAFLNGCNNLH